MERGGDAEAQAISPSDPPRTCMQGGPVLGKQRVSWGGARTGAGLVLE